MHHLISALQFNSFPPFPGIPNKTTTTKQKFSAGTQKIIALSFFRQRHVDAALADNGLPREGLALRLPEPLDRRYERHDQDGSVDSHRPGPPAHGDRRHPGQARDRPSRPQIQEHPRQDQRHVRHRRSWPRCAPRCHHRHRRHTAQQSRRHQTLHGARGGHFCYPLFLNFVCRDVSHVEVRVKRMILLLPRVGGIEKSIVFINTEGVLRLRLGFGWDSGNIYNKE